VRGDRHDLNGPHLAQSLLSLGVEPAELRIVGDVPADLETALRDGLAYDLLVVSGGLGPTHDDRTVELLASVAGRELRLDEALRADIEARSRAVANRLRLPYAGFEAGVRKQATVPDGAIVAGLAGTAPSLVLDLDRSVAVTLPGPPRELQALWPVVLETEPLRRLLASVRPRERRVLRFFGVGESTVARVLEDAGGDGRGVEVTICARDSEIHVDLFVEPGADGRADELEAAIAEPISDYLFATREAAVEEIVLELCRERGLSLATAESCTGGLVAARLTSVPGSSDVFKGSVVAYSNAVKESELSVSPDTLREHGAVSAETAGEMSRGVRSRLGADVAVAVTGIAGPGGGSEEKPVGLVYLDASGPSGALSADFVLPSDRDTIRRRSAIAALHLVRRLVSEL
jgi:competence/damage-inducible protein CinA-like protein